MSVRAYTLVSCTGRHAELFNEAEGEFDAAEIDKELISTRLKQDVLEHSGKIHLYIADSVRTSVSHRSE